MLTIICVLELYPGFNNELHINVNFMSEIARDQHHFNILEYIILIQGKQFHRLCNSFYQSQGHT